MFEPYKDNLLAEKGEFEEILDKDIKFDIKFIYKCCNIVNGIKQESKKIKYLKYLEEIWNRWSEALKRKMSESDKDLKDV